MGALQSAAASRDSERVSIRFNGPQFDPEEEIQAVDLNRNLNDIVDVHDEKDLDMTKVSPGCTELRSPPHEGGR